MNSFDEEDLDSETTVFIINSLHFAEKLAWSTRGSWDGGNAVSIKNPGHTAIETIVDLFEVEFGIEVEFCQSGDFCCDPRSGDPKKIHTLTVGETGAGKSIFIGLPLIRNLTQQA